jgi:hypothetical protein
MSSDKRSKGFSKAHLTETRGQNSKQFERLAGANAGRRRGLESLKITTSDYFNSLLISRAGTRRERTK